MITNDLIEKIIICIISSMAISIFPVYYWHKLLNKKLNFKNKSIYISVILIALFGTLATLYLDSFTKMLIVALFMIIINYFLFSKDIKVSVASTLVSWFILMISELFLTTLIVILFPNLDPDNLSLTNLSVLNFTVFIFAFIISKFKIFFIIYKRLISITSNMRNKKLLSYTLIIISIICIFTVFSYYDWPVLLTLIVNSIISILYMVVIFQMFKAENNYQRIYGKYTNSLSSLKEYEQLMETQKIENHENKNQFLTIRTMILNNEKNVIEYIDSLVEEKIEFDEKILQKLSKIPEGGLRAIIYTKLNKIEKLKIDCDLYISKKVYGADLLRLGDSLMLDICKIIGVFLDNAIEAVQNLNDKEINIDMYMDGCYLYIEISNNYSGTIDINSIDEPGYTTKETGHGYGLSLVKDIINKNNLLENEKQLTNDYFTQILKIKM